MEAQYRRQTRRKRLLIFAAAALLIASAYVFTTLGMAQTSLRLLGDALWAYFSGPLEESADPTLYKVLLLLRLPRIARRRGIRGAPILVLGDLNMDVEKVRRGSGLGVLAEGLTYPEDAPDAQIDHVLGWGMVPGGEASVVHLPVSDHAGLVADVEFE